MKLLDQHMVVITVKRYRLDCGSVIVRHTHKQEPEGVNDTYLLEFDHARDLGEFPYIFRGIGVRLMRPGYREAFKEVDPFIYDEDGICLFDRYSYEDKDLDRELHHRMQGGVPINGDELVLVTYDNILYDVDLVPIPVVISLDYSYVNIGKLDNPTGFISHLRHHPRVINKDKLGPVYDPMTGIEFWGNGDTGYLEILMDDGDYGRFVKGFNDSDEVCFGSYLKRKDVIGINKIMSKDDF